MHSNGEESRGRRVAKLGGAAALGVAALAVVRLLQPGVDEPAVEPELTGRASVNVDLSTPEARAYRSARAALLREPKHDINDAWIVGRLLASGGEDAELRHLLKRVAQTATTDPLGCLIKPDLPGPAIIPGQQGFARLAMIWRTPCGEPEAQATALAAEFLAEPHEGYMLSQQITLYEWFEEQGRALPPEALALRPALERKLLEEQRAKQGELFHDLYVERVAFLLAFTDVSLEQARPWIDRIVELQRPDGTWGQFMWDVEYQGDRHTVVDDGRHTLLLGMLALRTYLDRTAQAGG